MRYKEKRFLALLLACVLSLNASISVSAGDSSPLLNIFSLLPVAAYGEYVQNVELGEYMVFNERDLNSSDRTDEVFKQLAGRSVDYVRLATMNSQVSGYPKHMTKNFDLLVDFFSKALEMKKQFSKSTESETELLTGMTWEDLEKEDIKMYFDTMKDYIEVSYAIALRENIELDFGLADGSDGTSEYSDLEQTLQELFDLFNLDEALIPALMEYIKGTVVLTTVEDYLAENAYVIEEVDYIFPESDIRYLTEDDVEGLTVQEINYGKNEIFARLGKKFSSEELQSYFDSKSWYEGIYDPEDFDQNYKDDLLNGFEKANVEFLTEVEYSMSPDGYVLDQ